MAGAARAEEIRRSVDASARLEERRVVVEAALGRNLPAEGEYPPRIHEALRYACLGGGKRLRPLVTMAAVESVGGSAESVLKAACAVEYVHCCSLVLDDLPSMDNALMRRGRPATHRVFGVATSMLAADALLMHAFRLVADNAVDVGADGPRTAQAVRDLATAVGSFGMVGGQHVDLETAGSAVEPATLEYIQTRKTGALFAASATVGCVLIGAPADAVRRLSEYARSLGLAYQIVDDILDAEGDPVVMGKDAGQDARKATFVTVHGVDAARRAARALGAAAKRALEGFDGDAGALLGIVDQCLTRSS
ncbi:MAG: polyprenyl synthetase family protein [Candidatus Eisenbacteria bacterium]|nr:polyprenyl synthetase family protein [Candidatus Eisenbacteria bacterium]